jgi:hypothetical protein
MANMIETLQKPQPMKGRLLREGLNYYLWDSNSFFLITRRQEEDLLKSYREQIGVEPCWWHGWQQITIEFSPLDTSKFFAENIPKTIRDTYPVSGVAGIISADFSQANHSEE